LGVYHVAVSSEACVDAGTPDAGGAAVAAASTSSAWSCTVVVVVLVVALAEARCRIIESYDRHCYLAVRSFISSRPSSQPPLPHAVHHRRQKRPRSRKDTNRGSEIQTRK
jgi:hypothetical protein